MSGIAALAAAAAATQKLTTGTPGMVSPITTVTGTTPRLKILQQPTIVTPQGVRVTPVQGGTGKSKFLVTVSL